MYLNTHSYYSFKYGTMSIDELLENAARMQVRSMALTDINSTSGCMLFIRNASKYDIKPLIGIDFRNGVKQQFTGIAKNPEGFYELNTHLSQHLHTATEIPAIAPPFKNAFVIYPVAGYSGHPLRENEYVGISVNDLAKFRFSTYRGLKNKLVIQQTTTFNGKRHFNAHRLMRAIHHNILLSKLPEEWQGDVNDIMYPTHILREYFRDFPEIISTTEKLLDECEVCFDFSGEIDVKNLKTYTGSVRNDLELIKQKCEEGIHYRYVQSKDVIRERLDKELDIIIQKGFLSYFLISWDIVDYARRMNYPYVGRGSGANSLVAYLMRITDVDPLELDLYFERFINLYRKNPPDFDIDLASRNRQAMTDYIFNRFDHTALLATYNTFQYKAVIREIGKVFGLPPHEIDALSGRKPTPDAMQKLVLKYGALIQGMPSHLSVHAGGILISERDIHHYTATHIPPKGFPTTQFDMIVAEDIGLHKFDILGQRGLSKIQDAIRIVEHNYPSHRRIDIHNVKPFFNDEKVKSLLREGNAIGCFYVESPAMRMLLKKLKADTYQGLVAASSIIRPGVAKSGMMREYILRFQKLERIKEANPILLNIMPETFGVMVYQEDVIKVAHHFAGLTLAEADVLRRGMSGKFRSREEFLKVKNQFFENCVRKGYDVNEIRDVWRQIESFAGYAFSKGHSASYAVESYQSLYLKAYYPLEYIVATLNNGGGFYRQELYINEARIHGATIKPPCINTSQIRCIIIDTTIYLGLGMIRGIERNLLEQIIHDRAVEGPYESLENFIARVRISLEQLTILIRIDAFASTGFGKKELLWKAYLLLGNTKKSNPHYELFPRKSSKFKMPTLHTHQFENAFDEMELLGFPLTSPFLLLKTPVGHYLRAKDLAKHLNTPVEIFGYLITVKRTKTSKQEEMGFGTFIDINGEFIDTVHCPPVFDKYPFRGSGIYQIKGLVVEEFGFLSIEVAEMHKQPYIYDPRYSDEDPPEVVEGQPLTPDHRPLPTPSTRISA